MKIQPTILNIPAALFLAGCLVYTVINYSTLSHAEGWGVVFMVAIIAMGATAFIADLVIHNVVKSPKMQLILRSNILLAYVCFFYFGLKNA